MITNLKEAVEELVTKPPNCTQCTKQLDGVYYKTSIGHICARYTCHKCNLEFHPIRNFSEEMKTIVSYAKKFKKKLGL